MALSTTHRQALFSAFAPLAGEEATEAMLSGHPATEDDELVTKQFLRAELAETRTELTGDIAQLRADLTGNIAGLRTELKGDSLTLRGDLTLAIADLRTELHQGLASQTRWMVGTILTSVGLSVAINQLLG